MFIYIANPLHTFVFGTRHGLCRLKSEANNELIVLNQAGVEFQAQMQSRVTKIFYNVGSDMVLLWDKAENYRVVRFFEDGKIRIMPKFPFPIDKPVHLLSDQLIFDEHKVIWKGNQWDDETVSCQSSKIIGTTQSGLITMAIVMYGDQYVTAQSRNGCVHHLSPWSADKIMQGGGTVLHYKDCLFIWDCTRGVHRDDVLMLANTRILGAEMPFFLVHMEEIDKVALFTVENGNLIEVVPTIPLNKDSYLVMDNTLRIQVYNLTDPDHCLLGSNNY